MSIDVELDAIFPIGNIDDMSKHQQPMPVTRVRTTDHLGSLVRAARQASAADQQTAAGLLGVGTRFLGDVERGKPNVRLGLVLQVLAGLGLEVWIAPRGWRPREP